MPCHALEPVDAGKIGSEFTLLEPRSTFESRAVAEVMTKRLVAEYPDLASRYIAGGALPAR